MTKNKRIYVALSPEVYKKVIELAKKEKRKKSPMAAMLIEDGLKLADKK
jgi:predicted transcriptional regulator